MPSPREETASGRRARKRRFGRKSWGFLLALILFSGAWLLLRGGGEEDASGTTFTVTRGDLEILVTEGGSIEAKESQEVRSEVQGQTKILSIVDEGYFVSQEDIKNGLVLVELDSKELIDRQTQQELEFQNSYATYTEAREQYDITVNQNESDIKAASLAAKFAKMDLEKYLSADVAQSILDELGLEKASERALAEIRQSMQERDAEELQASEIPVYVEEAEEGEGEGEKNAVALEPGEPSSARPAPCETPAADDGEKRTEGGNRIEVTSTYNVGAGLTLSLKKYADVNLLGDGEAGQKLRKFEDDLILAQNEEGLADEKLKGTQRLFDRGFVTKNELENDQLALQRRRISTQSAITSKDLYIKYEFPKQAEKLLSDYEEALRKLQRAMRTASAKLAQAKARLNSAEARYELQKRRRKELAEQIAKCVIKAKRSGLVVYGSNQQWWRNEQRIEEGATVRERQVIITIPDTTLMEVNVKVHESVVKKVKKGQRARIRVDAFPDEVLEGRVEKISVLPDSQNRWMSPDLKVYGTTILVEGTHAFLKPGMSAEAEIIIDTLKDVLQVPLQAVSPNKGEQVCYVLKGNTPERRVVETGQFNDTFVEIVKGLEEGETVLLRVPDALREEPGGTAPEVPRGGTPGNTTATAKKQDV